MDIRILVDLVLAVFAIEVLVLAVFGRRFRGLPPLRALLPNLAAGLSLVLALRSAVHQDGTALIGLFLALGGSPTCSTCDPEADAERVAVLAPAIVVRRRHVVRRADALGVPNPRFDIATSLVDRRPVLAMLGVFGRRLRLLVAVVRQRLFLVRRGIVGVGWLCGSSLMGSPAEDEWSPARCLNSIARRSTGGRRLGSKIEPVDKNVHNEHSMTQLRPSFDG